MGLNTKIKQKYEDAYKNLPPMLRRPLQIISEDSIFEEWRMISSLYALDVIDNMYRVSSFGRIQNIVNGNFLSPYQNPKGYLTVSLRSDNYKTGHIVYKVHRLVMLHFKFRPDCYLLEIDHKNTIKTDNHIWNLEWVTPQENTHRAINSGLRQLSCTTESGTLLTDEQAHNLFQEMYEYYNFDYPLDIEQIAAKYNVKVEYAKSLYTGSIRPYIAAIGYDRFHYDTQEEQQKRNEFYNIK